MSDAHARHSGGIVRLRLAQLWFVLAVRPWRQYALTEHPAAKRFFAERAPHLAGMIAYFAVFSLIPAAFLVLTLLAMTADPAGQGFVLEQLHYVFPESSITTVENFVARLQDEIGSLGWIGIAGLVWGTLGFFSATESGFNIIYGVENRMFFKQKVWVLFLVVMALALMLAAVVLASAVVPLLTRVSDSDLLSFDWSDAAISIGISTFAAFVFFYSVYRFLPNTEVRTRHVWRGAAVAAILFEISVHVLQLYISGAGGSLLTRAFAGLLVLLVWFYVMALIMLLGATLNWWWAHPGDLRREVRRHSFDAMPRRRLPVESAAAEEDGSGVGAAVGDEVDD